MRFFPENKPRPRLVVFTDLDGTLLDHETYSFAPATEALDLLERQGIPLVLCSSKTRAEMELLRGDLRLAHPFISENGGAIFIPKDYFPFAPEGAQEIAGYQVLEFGAPYGQLVATLHRVAGQLKIPVVGFSDMSIEEVTQDCQLSFLEARLAKMREYDEPFRIASSTPRAENRLFRALHRAGLRCTRGGRYNHVTGVADKGQAVRTLKLLYERECENLLAIGLGDSLNDLPLFEAVDIPVIVQNPAAGATARLLRKIPIARVTRAPGPWGWNEAVLEILESQAASPRGENAAERPPRTAAQGATASRAKGGGTHV